MSAPKQIRVRQGSPAWLAYRRTHIGSSDAPAIAGESPYSSALSVYADKTGPAQEPDPGTARLFRIGHAMEPVILDLYEEETGHKVRRSRVLESRDIPWLSASLDGDTPGRVVEAKWTGTTRFSDGVPGDVLVQVTHQMAVAQLDRADVAVLTPRDFTIYTVDFDATFWDHILALETRFMEDHLVPRIPPDPDETEASRRAISRMYPADDGEMIEADPDMATLIRKLLAGKEQLAALEAEVDGHENALRFLIGDHSGVNGPDFRVTYRKSADSSRVAWTEYAGSLEAMIPPERLPEAEALRGIYTTVKQGPRRLLVTRQEAQG
uniref:Putative exonuclease n=1 Tax=viral metagenome TaxID=1070528 RepID=A0A6M3JIZ6_9ZZZZ